MLTRRQLMAGAAAIAAPAILSPRIAKYDFASIDFETRGIRDLRKVGVHKYCEDPWFEIMCMGWAINNDPVQLWKMGQPMPKALQHHVERGRMLHAWNAQFERVAWNAGLPAWPQPKINQWRCTMVRSLACGLPAALAKAAIAARIKERKDVTGAKAMSKLSKPRNARALKTGEATEPVWWDDPVLFLEMHDYCKQDVVTERQMGEFLPLLQQSEEKQYWYDQMVADRGIIVDQVLCKSAIQIIKERSDELNLICKETTGFYPTQVPQIRKWIETRGVDIPNLQKETVTKLVHGGLIDSDVRDVLLARQEVGMASTSKYESALNRLCVDGTVKGARQFYGAHTGRWAGRGVQFDNMPRPTMKNLDDVVELVRTGDAKLVESVYDNVMQPVQNSIRGFIVADEDETLYVGDYKSIESRMLGVMSGQQSVLDQWRLSDLGKGPDVYVVQAASIFGCSIKEAQHKDKRNIGKIAELLLGYEGGTAALFRPAQNTISFRDIYDVLYKNADESTRSKVDWVWNLMGKEDEGRGITEKDWRAARFIVERWRSNNPMSVKFWKQIRKASIEAVRKPGIPARYRGITYIYSKRDRMLYCRLMSGRELRYPFAHLVVAKSRKKGETELQLRASSWNDRLHKFVEYHPYGGFLTENIDQAQSRDVMAERFQPLEYAGFKVRHSVHDELITSAKKKLNLTVKDFEKTMAIAPPWAPKMPVAVEAWAGPRYRKD